MSDYQQIPGPNTVTWHGFTDLPYEGKPLAFDHALPGGGLLNPNSNATNVTGAIVFQWLLHVSGKTYRSPLLALRH